MLVSARCIAIFSALVTCAAVQAADHAYRYLDADGKPVYSQLPPPPGVSHEKVDVSPAGSGKAKPVQSRRDEKARHSTANEAVPFREVWRESERKADKAAQGAAPVVKPVPMASSAQCGAGQGADCKATTAPSK